MSRLLGGSDWGRVRVTSVERTAYPVFPRLMTARELYTYFSPSEEELERAREKTDTDEHQLALALALKCFQKLGRFPKAREVPAAVVDHVRRCLWPDDTVIWTTTSEGKESPAPAQVAAAVPLG